MRENLDGGPDIKKHHTKRKKKYSGNIRGSHFASLDGKIWGIILERNLETRERGRSQPA